MKGKAPKLLGKKPSRGEQPGKAAKEVRPGGGERGPLRKCNPFEVASYYALQGKSLKETGKHFHIVKTTVHNYILEALKDKKFVQMLKDQRSLQTLFFGNLLAVNQPRLITEMAKLNGIKFVVSYGVITDKYKELSKSDAPPVSVQDLKIFNLVLEDLSKMKDARLAKAIPAEAYTVPSEDGN